MSAFLLSRSWPLLLAVVAFVLGGWCGAQLYRPEVESLRVQLVEARRAVEVSRAEVGRQNAEVERLEAETRALLAKAEQVRAQARRQASQDYATAARILLEPPAEGDRCEAARQAFVAELKKERGL